MPGGPSPEDQLFAAELASYLITWDGAEEKQSTNRGGTGGTGGTASRPGLYVMCLFTAFVLLYSIFGSKICLA